MAVKEIDPKTGHKKLRVIANKLVELAMQGNISAASLIADRLDGKPLSEANIIHYDNKTELYEYSDEELLQIINSQPEDPVSVPGTSTKQ